uniref:DUF6824 domain-containing protein n=1 Tax=Leptocylindrus danicus TaxID=163516 RepID=A0A7S2NTP9_9STRA|mmetsp:Transcript_13351/g.19876  ORF Transcript_13351/g.19876 Transcript_13351/m.19876 type:complete len:381 (+) Transcript_13351:186-1328(+)|eukprot:CAMPEP_0116026182 /NCGR_PEP_ID=MMETSP0321-20121206/13650_1 /TAXON_ID=163516 /ORGANISM="Leptocylindrus danicus var. danicus, Strain B650" /LENGTH=380 /DNA_ID=CAMNT_0003498835 /DNA_START=349 /DNA_END=1491 /DNA_ORIENTATION=+
MSANKEGPTYTTTTPGPHDVLCGRGGRINSHEGNVKFREIIATRKADYLSPATRKLQKAVIAQEVVDVIRNKGGRFLKEKSSGVWEEVTDEKAKKKCGQALREDAPVFREETDHQVQAAPDAAIVVGMNPEYHQGHYAEMAAPSMPNPRQQRWRQQLGYSNSSKNCAGYAQDSFDYKLSEMIAGNPQGLTNFNAGNGQPSLQRSISAITSNDYVDDPNEYSMEDSFAQDSFANWSMNFGDRPPRPNNGHTMPSYAINGRLRSYTGDSMSNRRRSQTTDSDSQMYSSMRQRSFTADTGNSYGSTRQRSTSNMTMDDITITSGRTRASSWLRSFQSVENWENMSVMSKISCISVDMDALDLADGDMNNTHSKSQSSILAYEL